MAWSVLTFFLTSYVIFSCKLYLRPPVALIQVTTWGREPLIYADFFYVKPEMAGLTRCWMKLSLNNCLRINKHNSASPPWIKFDPQNDCDKSLIVFFFSPISRVEWCKLCLALLRWSRKGLWSIEHCRRFLCLFIHCNNLAKM